MLAFCEMQILSLPGWVRKCFSVSTMSWYIFKASLSTGRLLWEKMEPIFKSRWAVSPAIQVRLSLMMNRCQKLPMLLCLSSLVFAKPLFVSRALPWGLLRWGWRGARSSIQPSVRWGCACLFCLPSPFRNVVCKHCALRTLLQLMRFEGQIWRRGVLLPFRKGLMQLSCPTMLWN